MPEVVSFAPQIDLPVSHMRAGAVPPPVGRGLLEELHPSGRFVGKPREARVESVVDGDLRDAARPVLRRPDTCADVTIG